MEGCCVMLWNSSEENLAMKFALTFKCPGWIKCGLFRLHSSPAIRIWVPFIRKHYLYDPIYRAGSEMPGEKRWISHLKTWNSGWAWWCCGASVTSSYSQDFVGFFSVGFIIDICINSSKISWLNLDFLWPVLWYAIAMAQKLQNPGPPMLSLRSPFGTGKVANKEKPEQGLGWAWGRRGRSQSQRCKLRNVSYFTVPNCPESPQMYAS